MSKEFHKYIFIIFSSFIFVISSNFAYGLDSFTIYSGLDMSYDKRNDVLEKFWGSRIDFGWNLWKERFEISLGTNYAYYGNCYFYQKSKYIQDKIYFKKAKKLDLHLSILYKLPFIRLITIRLGYEFALNTYDAIIFRWETFSWPPYYYEEGYEDRSVEFSHYYTNKDYYLLLEIEIPYKLIIFYPSIIIKQQLDRGAIVNNDIGSGIVYIETPPRFSFLIGLKIGKDKSR